MYICNLPKLNLEEIESLNGPIKEMESVVNLSINKTKHSRPKQFYRQGRYLSRNTSRSLKSYTTNSSKDRKQKLSSSFYKASRTWILELYTDTMTKGK